MKNAIITIPESGNNVDVKTNGIHLITILNALNNLQRGLCQQLVKEAENAVGGNPKAQEQYLDRLIKQIGRHEDGLDAGGIISKQ